MTSITIYIVLVGILALAIAIGCFILFKKVFKLKLAPTIVFTIFIGLVAPAMTGGVIYATSGSLHVIDENGEVDQYIVLSSTTYESINHGEVSLKEGRGLIINESAKTYLLEPIYYGSATSDHLPINIVPLGTANSETSFIVDYYPNEKPPSSIKQNDSNDNGYVKFWLREHQP